METLTRKSIPYRDMGDRAVVAWVTITYYGKQDRLMLEKSAEIMLSKKIQKKRMDGRS